VPWPLPGRSGFELRREERKGRSQSDSKTQELGSFRQKAFFRQFQRGAESGGLGLYVSRAIMRSFGGELSYEPRSEGCGLTLGVTQEEVVNA
jgi:signal transduction histidine kinase